MIKVTDDTFEKFKTSGNKKKILKLGANWCSPCMASVPACNQLSQELKNDFDIGELDIEEAVNTATMLSCKGVPLFIKFDQEGKEVSRKVGWPGIEELRSWITSN